MNETLSTVWLLLLKCNRNSVQVYFHLILKDLQSIGIDERGHREQLVYEIEKLPKLDIAQEVPVGETTFLYFFFYNSLN